MKTTPISRRALATGLALAPVVGLPALAGDGRPRPSPTFGMIGVRSSPPISTRPRSETRRKRPCRFGRGPALGTFIRMALIVAKQSMRHST
jgi:hypothetical protein